MHRLLISASLSLTATACHRPPAPAPPSIFAVADSAEWECGGNGGWYGILERDGVYVDSIDLAVGIIRIPSGMIYAPVRSVQETPEVRFVCPLDPVVLRGGSRRPATDVLALMHTQAPAMTAIGSAVLYWGFSGDRIYATRHDFATARLDTTFLANDENLTATDNRFQFLPPQVVDSTYHFPTVPGTRFTLDWNWRLIRTDTVLRPASNQR